MKKALAVLLSLMVMLSMTALPGLFVSADVDGRVAAELSLKASVTKKTPASKDKGKLIDKSVNMNALDLNGYNADSLALEMDLYVEGDLAAFKKGLTATVSIFSGSASVVWNFASVDWKEGEWFRVTLPMSEATKRGSFDFSAVNRAQFALYSTGGVGNEYSFKALRLRIVDLDKGATGTDPIGDGTVKVREPNWQLVKTEYPTTEALIAGYNFGEYFAANTDMDATRALQALINAMNEKGGGTIFIPAGTYTFTGTLNIPEGVTIQGDWRAPTAEHPEATGTIFKIYSGRGNDNSTAFITMKPNTCVQGITFWYPEQDPQDIKPYPVTIKMFDASSWGKDYTHVRNCTFVNSYRAVQQGPGGNGCPNVYNVYGTPLYLGLFMDAIADIGRFDYVSFAPSYWENSGLPGAPATDEAKEALERYIAENATGLMAGRTDWSYWTFSEITGYNTGMYFVESPAEIEAGNRNAYSNGHVYGLTFNDCGTGIRFDGISSAGQLFSNITFNRCKTGIRTVKNDGEMGNLQMNHMTFDTDVAIEHGGNIRLFLNASTFKRGEVILSGGPTTISGSTFETAAPQVTLKPGASCGILQGNTATSGEFQVNNLSMCPLQISDKAVQMDDINLLKPEQAADKTVKAAREVLYVADLTKDGSKDVTAALQTLLDKAGQEGGGYVFLPGGDYRLDGSVTVPSGVELVGAVDIGRNVYQIGTIFRVYGRQKDATVILSENSGLRGVVFDYPEQGNTVATLKEDYPFTVQGRGANVYIVNINIRNGFDGIDLMSYRCDNHYVKYLAGFCFHSVIKVGGGSVGGKIINYQMNSSGWWNGNESKYGSWKNCPTNDEKGDAVKDNDGNIIKPENKKAGANQLRNVYVQSNCAILTVGDVTDEVLFDNFSYLGAIGAYFVKENGKGANGWNVGNAYDYSTVGIQVDGIGKMDFINVQIVSYNQFDIDKTRHQIYLTDQCTDKVNVLNLACWATPNTFLRVDGGELNVYCGDFTATTESNSFAELTNNGHIYLQNGTISNTNVTGLAKGAIGNLSISGYINERELNGQNNSRWGINMVRVSRWDVPTNATIDTTQKMFFTEAFTDYKTETSSGGVENALPKGGSFSSSLSKPNSNVTIVNDNGNGMMRLYHDGNALMAYARALALRLNVGHANDTYMMESRLNVKQLRESGGEDSALLMMMYAYTGVTTMSPTQLIRFTPSGVYVGETKLADYTKDTWYRVQVNFDLTDVSRKSYTVRLLSDDYQEIGKSDSILFDDSYQNNDFKVSMLDFTLKSLVDKTENASEALVDYAFVTQDPTELPTNYGDVNSDGAVDAADAVLVLQYAASLIDNSAIDMQAADVNNDGSVDTADAVLILQKAAELIDKFPAEG